LASFGFAEQDSLNVLKISKNSLQDKYTRFSVNVLTALYKSAATALDDPEISLRTGFQFRVSTFEQTGNIYTVCDNIRQVVHMNSLYQRMAIYAGDVSLVCDEKNGKNCFLNFSSFYEDTPHNRHITNVIFGAYGTAFRWLNWGSGKGLKAVHLRQAEPENITLFDKVFDCPVNFGAAHNRLEFFPEHLDLEFPTRNPAKRAQFESQLKYAMGKTAKKESVLATIRVKLIEQMSLGRVDFASLADAMSLTEKDLRSQLKDVGSNFRSELDAARIEVFKQCIHRNESFVQIAQQLCYNDQAAFSRAFKRWYGVAPGNWTPETPLLK
jgi:AraC-like DNA-binding protein